MTTGTGRRFLIIAGIGALALATVAATLFIGIADTTTVIVTEIRAPRIALGLLVGAGLGVSGSLLQGSLRNPLADPGIIGVSAGAALGAVLAVAVGAAYGSWLSAVAAALFGGLAIAGVLWIARGRDGQTEVVTLILAGVAMTAFTAAALSVVVAMADTAGSRSTTFWTTGSLALATWPSVLTVLPFLAVGVAMAFGTARSLDVMALGDRAARAGGVHVNRVRLIALIAAVLLVAGGVAMVGVIAFVGLVVPHAARLLLGPRHAWVIAGSALLGAVLILWSDTIARSIAAPVELPLGVVTAAIGAPAFVILLRRTRATQGGWA